MNFLYFFLVLSNLCFQVINMRHLKGFDMLKIFQYFVLGLFYNFFTDSQIEKFRVAGYGLFIAHAYKYITPDETGKFFDFVWLKVLFPVINRTAIKLLSIFDFFVAKF